MKRPKNVTLKKYWEAHSSTERIEIVEGAFTYIKKLEKENDSLRKDINNRKNQ